MVYISVVIHQCAHLPRVTCHLFDFMLLRDVRDSEDVRVVKRAVTHTPIILCKGVTESLIRHQHLKKSECPYTAGPLYLSAGRDDTTKICTAELVVFPQHLM